MQAFHCLLASAPLGNVNSALPTHNAVHAYKFKLNRHTRTRIHARSKKWSGTARHRMGQLNSIHLTLHEMSWRREEPRSRRILQRSDHAAIWRRDIEAIGGPDVWVRRIIELIAEGQNLGELYRYMITRLRVFALYQPRLFAQILSQLRALSGNGRAVFDLILALVIAAFLLKTQLGRRTRPHPAPRPVRLLVRPKPPTAPLAPPI